MKRIISLLSFSLLLMSSCEKEKIVEIEKEYKWKSHERFKYDNVVQMNSFATNEMLFFNSPDNFSSMSSGSSNHNDVSFFANQFEHPITKKLPINSDFFISYTNIGGWLQFSSTMNPLMSGATSTWSSISIESLDSSYSNFNFIHYLTGECIAINERGQALVPYRAHADSRDYIKLALIDVHLEMNTLYYVTLGTVKLIEINDDNQLNVITIKSIRDNFFVSTCSRLYRIDSYGNIENVLGSRLYRVIESDGNLYGFGHENLFVSSDNGLTWREGFALPYDYSLISYTVIDEQIIGYRYGQLWHVTINDSEIKYKELDNDGLDGVSITSISKFDGRIYLTTLSGVYYKMIDLFYDYKENVE